ncbi:hypothetical protein GN244_ATG02911 [Phytophthora infestans]|nr:hypothetical protein GN244_ATG02911 [Phytophthora infestans]KAF4132890.1 hypothetical protein GN958_ATG17934 [Phytophthora infestans]
MSDLAAKGSAIEEERTGNIDPKVIQKLLKADDIKAALDDYDKQVALFTKWMADEMTTSAILGKLSEKDKIIENMPILAKFNDFRSTFRYNEKLTDWLDTKTLDDIIATLKASKTEPMKLKFTAMYRSGVTPDAFAAAIAMVTNARRQ